MNQHRKHDKRRDGPNVVRAVVFPQVRDDHPLFWWFCSAYTTMVLWMHGRNGRSISPSRERERERATARRVELVSIIVSETSHFQPECASLSFSPDGTTSFIERRLFTIVCLREIISLSLSLGCSLLGGTGASLDRSKPRYSRGWMRIVVAIPNATSSSCCIALHHHCQ